MPAPSEAPAARPEPIRADPSRSEQIGSNGAPTRAEASRCEQIRADPSGSERASGPEAAPVSSRKPLGNFTIIDTPGLDQPLDDPRRERLAQELAAGCSYAEATRRAGFHWVRHGKRAARSAQMRERVAAIIAARAGGASRDLASCIDGMLAVAAAARSDKLAPQAAVASRAAYESAAKYKLLLPQVGAGAAPSRAAAAPAEPPEPTDADMSQEEWLARYGADAPGGLVGRVGEPDPR